VGALVVVVVVVVVLWDGSRPAFFSLPVWLF
jgi:hypothetical protein